MVSQNHGKGRGIDLGPGLEILWSTEVEKTRMLMAHGVPPVLVSMWCIKLHGLKYSILFMVTQAAKDTRWYSDAV